MTVNQIILLTFFSGLSALLVAGYLTKIYRKKKGAHKIPGVTNIDFELKEDIFELGKLATILDDLERYHIPLKTILELNIIIEEVFSSIITRQQKAQQGNKVLIRLKLEKGHITVTIKDKNDEFDPTIIPAIDLNAPLEEISFHGLGFHMVRNLADHLGYQRLDHQNILTIKKSYQS